MKTNRVLAFLMAIALSAVPVAAFADVLTYDDGTYETLTALSPTAAPAVQFDAPGTGVYALDTVTFYLDAAAPGTYPVAVQVWDDTLAVVQTIPWDVTFTSSALYTLDLTSAKVAFTGSVRVGIFVRNDALVPIPGAMSLGADSVSTLPFGHSYLYDLAAVPPTDPWTPDAAANAGIQASVRLVPALSCQGFLPPFNHTMTLKQGGRTIPLKAFLFDSAGAPVTRSLVTAGPLVQLLFAPDATTAPVDVTASVGPAGRSNAGPAFRSNGNGRWMYNLKTKKNLAPGTYTVLVGSGGATEYVVEPTCSGTFVITAPKTKKPHPTGGPK